MEIQDAILTRRSIRKYTDKKISEDLVNAILRAAMYAPSAMNQQPWHFIVVDDASLLQKLSRIHPYGKMLSDASHGILVCGDEKLQL
ncbi:MAG: nitroreductase family protein, partial [Bacteroidales bacterium]|nr:nitroreductase family protein [Bacteroidales bacterium]